MILRSFVPAFATLLLLPLLAGCGIYQSQYGCRVPDGPRCQSLRQTYLGGASSAGMVPIPEPARSVPPAPPEPWTPPVKTIWIAPWVDSAGRHHEASLLRILIFPGAKALRAEPELVIPPIPEAGEDGPEFPPPPPPGQPERTPDRPREGRPRPDSSSSRPNTGARPAPGAQGQPFQLPPYAPAP